MRVLAVCPADEPDHPVPGREAIEILGDIKASLRHIEMLAAQRKDDPLLAAALLRATDAAVAAENLAEREVIAEEIKQDAYARGRADMAREVAACQRLRPVS